jgi:hypothetical protein
MSKNKSTSAAPQKKDEKPTPGEEIECAFKCVYLIVRVTEYLWDLCAPWPVTDPWAATSRMRNDEYENQLVFALDAMRTALEGEEIVIRTADNWLPSSSPLVKLLGYKKPTSHELAVMLAWHVLWTIKPDLETINDLPAESNLRRDAAKICDDLERMFRTDLQRGDLRDLLEAATGEKRKALQDLASNAKSPPKVELTDDHIKRVLAEVEDRKRKAATAKTELRQMSDGMQAAFTYLKTHPGPIGVVVLANRAGVTEVTIRKWCNPKNQGPLYLRGVRNDGTKQGYYYSASHDRSLKPQKRKRT